MKILICEDELIIAEFLKETCIELGYKVCAVAGTKQEAIDKLVIHQPDLILIDINMEERYSGIQLADHINQTIKKPFIFITAFSDIDTINQAIYTAPHAYLVKPVDKSTLLANIQLSNHKYAQKEKSREEYVSFITDNGGHSINIADVVFVEASGNYCEFVFSNKSRELLRISMQTVETTLINKFVRVHKSFIVNPSFITGSSSLRVLVGTEQIPVGRVYKQNLYGYLDKL